MNMPAPRRILVICLRRIGDVLLATPLLRSLKNAWPEADIDALVFAGTAGMLEGNADVHRVIAWPQKASARERLKLIMALRREYELSFAVTASDRAQILAALASGSRVATVQREFQRPWLNPRRVLLDPAQVHTVTQSLLLARAAGVAPVAEVVPPRTADLARVEALCGGFAQPHAVVHPAPMYAYKAWTEAGWQALIAALRARGLRVLLSGGPDEAERALAARLVAAAHAPGDVISLAGELRFAELSAVLSAAAVYIGPDTSVTHLAAACGTRTIALFGPSNPVAWGPWPQGWRGKGNSPWQLRAPLQRSGRVSIVQGTTERTAGCVPCLQEGCERHLGSRSDCLDGLPLARVLAAVDQALAGDEASGPPARAPA